MNLDRYEKIDGREALRRLVDGLSVFEKNGAEFSYDFETNETIWVRKDGKKFIGNGNAYPITLEAIVGGPWYIPKPFDVRQTMIDRPNEWVGAIEHGGHWFKVGFDLKRMAVVSTILKNDVPVLGHHPVVSDAFVLRLDDCIPIEDAPKEANQ